MLGIWWSFAIDLFSNIFFQTFDYFWHVPIKWLSLKRGFGGCGHGFDGCNRLGGLGGFDELGGFGGFDGLGGFCGFDGFNRLGGFGGFDGFGGFSGFGRFVF